MTTVEVAGVLGVSCSTVRRLTAKGQLRSTRDALGARAYDRADVTRLKRAMTQAARAVRRCVFCATAVPQRRTYCEGADCRKRRQRLRWKKWHRSNAA